MRHGPRALLAIGVLLGRRPRRINVLNDFHLDDLGARLHGLLLLLLVPEFVSISRLFRRHIGDSRLNHELVLHGVLVGSTRDEQLDSSNFDLTGANDARDGLDGEQLRRCRLDLVRHILR